MSLHPSNSDRLVPLKLKMAEERIRQAQYSFNIALVSIITLTGISAAGATLLWTGKVSEGAIVASSGLLSSAACVRLAKDANDRVDRMLNELIDET